MPHNEQLGASVQKGSKPADRKYSSNPFVVAEHEFQGETGNPHDPKVIVKEVQTGPSISLEVNHGGKIGSSPAQTGKPMVDSSAPDNFGQEENLRTQYINPDAVDTDDRKR